MTKAMEYRQERAKLIKENRETLDLIEKEEREFSAEEQQAYDRRDADIDKFKDKIEKEERQAALDKDIEGNIIVEPVKAVPNDNSTEPRASKEYQEAYRRFLITGNPKGLMDRALQMDSDTAGGYMVAPQQFIADLIKALDNLVFVRPLAKVISIPKAESVGAPALDNDPADPAWTGEITTREEDSTMSVGKRELFPHPLAKLLKVSKKLVRASAIDVESLVRDRLAYKLAVVEENAFLNGSGSNQPLGVFTASAHGISTGQDVSTGNTTTEIKGDGLIEAKYSLKAGYRGRSRWIFHRDGVKNIRKLKDGEGKYIWQQGIATGRPDTILNMPVIESEYAPNTFTTGLYVGILGDFSFYWIADALDTSIQTLVELYAATNQNGYICLKETDGMPVLEEAFARVKLA